VEGPEVDIVEKIKTKTRIKNKKIVRVVKEIKKAGFKVLRNKEWQIEEDLVLKKGKVYTPNDKELRTEIIQLYYDILAAEHGKR